MNKFLNFYLKNDFAKLALNEILEKWSVGIYGPLDYIKYNFIISNKQKKDFTELFFTQDIIEKKYNIKLNKKNITRRKKDVVEKLFIDLDNDLTSYSYVYKCDSCNRKVSGQLKDFYYTIKSNNFVCKECKNTVSHRLDTYNKKYKKSIKEKYGVEHPLKSKEIRNKIEETCLERYGYTTPFGSPDLRNIAYKTMLDKYGKRGISGFGGGKKISLLENNFIKNFLIKYNNPADDIYCDQLNKQYFIDTSNGRKWLDLYIKNKKTVIQVHGDFWHGNLSIFDSSKIHPVIKETFEDVYNKSDLNDQAIYNTDKVEAYFVVWESSIKHDENKIIKQIIEYIKEGRNGFITL